jgi:hypothetical protein
MGSGSASGVRTLMASRSIGASRSPSSRPPSVRPSGWRHDSPGYELFVYGPLSLTFRCAEGWYCPRLNAARSAAVFAGTRLPTEDRALTFVYDGEVLCP